MESVRMVTVPYWLTRYALPAAFLVIATTMILVARGALYHEVAAPAARKPAPVARPALDPRRPPAARAPTYSVRSGDTLATIAERLGTTVDGLLALNPGIDPRALRVGQSLRVE